MPVSFASVARTTSCPTSRVCLHLNARYCILNYFLLYGAPFVMGHPSQERNLTNRTSPGGVDTVRVPLKLPPPGCRKGSASRPVPGVHLANALEHGGSASCKLMMSSESTAHIGRFLRDFPGPGGPRGRTGLSAVKCAKGDPAMLAAGAISDIWRGLQAGQRPYGISRSPFPPPPKACGRARALCSGRKEACGPAAPLEAGGTRRDAGNPGPGAGRTSTPRTAAFRQWSLRATAGAPAAMNIPDLRGGRSATAAGPPLSASARG